uniref:Uncharacterized protein n=1 Tax=Hordeum vulgare subsp. vulgare TaxID=112509 RepID=A0A8I6WS64_HORVV
MAGAHHKLRELSHHVRRRMAVALDKAMSRLCLLRKSCAHHRVMERTARWWRAMRCGAGQVWPPRLGSLLVRAAYILAVSWLGYLLLDDLKFRAPPAGDGGGRGRPRGIDLFFTAVSAMTVSSMSAVEMEVFFGSQLFVLIVLMFAGGEVFVSLVGLASKWSKLRKQAQGLPDNNDQGIELGTTPKPADDTDVDSWTPVNSDETSKSPIEAKRLRREAVRSLLLLVLAIIVAAHVLGATAIAAYVYASSGARRTLRSKALGVWTFAVFTTVSTFSSGGFMPNNENMAALRRDTGLQLLLVPLALAGNTLFPTLLAVCVRAAAAATRRPDLVEMTARNGRELTGYYHLLPARRCAMLAATVAGLVAVQVAMVCGMEWGGALRGMGPWEKVSNAVFVAVNSRHTGESTLDLSTLTPAIIVFLVLMMYVPASIHDMVSIPRELHRGRPPHEGDPGAQAAQERASVTTLLPRHLRRRHLRHREGKPRGRPAQLQPAQRRRPSRQRLRKCGLLHGLQLQ